jgi:signal transduction histidine kinase
VGVIITDPLGKFVENNEITSLIWGGHMHAEDLFEYDQFVAFEHLTGEQVRPEEWGLARALLHGETSVGELYDIVRFDGGRRSVVISAAPVMGADGEILGGVEITQDITGQRELERSEIVAKGRAELYLDILTHDIANFNTALMGYLVRLYYDRCDETSVPSNVNKCLGVLHASNELISIIQTVQRAGEGARERRDLGGMLQEVASELPVPPDRKVFIEQDIETGLLIDCNGLLREAFVNLLNNAVVHTTGEVRNRRRLQGASLRPPR